MAFGQFIELEDENVAMILLVFDILVSVLYRLSQIVFYERLTMPFLASNLLSYPIITSTSAIQSNCCKHASNSIIPPLCWLGNAIFTN